MGVTQSCLASQQTYVTLASEVSRLSNIANNVSCKARLILPSPHLILLLLLLIIVNTMTS